MLASFASAFPVRTINWTAAIAPKMAGTTYTFSIFQSQCPKYG